MASGQKKQSNKDSENPYRLLPSVDSVLAQGGWQSAQAEVGEAAFTEIVRSVLQGWRDQIQEGRLDAAGLQELLDAGALTVEVTEHLARENRRGVKSAINVSGVVLNTGLGRSPVHPEAAHRMAQAAGGFCVLEVDRDSGQRNQRDQRLGELLSRLTGAQAGIAVNNNAAAVLLLMHTFAKGREAIVSRGELVEIGGSFRIPDVLESAGARLVAVGATNRTRIADFQAAVVKNTGLLLKVHTSNFRVVGFTEEVPAEQLAELGKERGITSAWDLGSGRLEAPAAESLSGVGDETPLRTAVASGVDVVCFSGDKLLGGPQAGLLVGSKEAIAALRRCPMYRALRLDKVALAGLEATCELLLAGRGNEIPARAMLCMDAKTTRVRCEEIAQLLKGTQGLSVDVAASQSQPGSGSAPTAALDTFALKLSLQSCSPQAFSEALRRSEPPVFARVQEDVVWMDPRTLLAGQTPLLIAAIQQAVESKSA
ncbi:MAG: L-seryl-tRNA(Ser) seleniumtransferase [Planctomycetota bacterium]|jgi:L-seryl-tRNA(Ser) seleniumtransferase